MQFGRYLSPAGELILASARGALCLCDWAVNPRLEQNIRALQEKIYGTRNGSTAKDCKDWLKYIVLPDKADFAGKIFLASGADMGDSRANISGRAGETNEADSAILQRAVEMLDGYFEGKISTLTLPLSPAGSKFRTEVWQAISKAGYGSTLSYSELAEMTGRPSAVRAVASACASNPISIFIPCHRISPKNGAPGSYAGGKAAKALLLRLERECGLRSQTPLPL